MQKKGAQRERILHLLEEEGGVTEDVVRRISLETGVPEADIWGTGLFYTLVSKPGKRVRVCDGLSCRIKGSDELFSKLRDAGKECEPVSCLGQCDRAPATLDEDLEQVCYGVEARGIVPDDPELPMNLGGPVRDSYSSLAKARETGSDAVIAEIEAAKLQGRGGAGFPAHIKWKGVRGQKETERYVICNADEAEPGTFKDREIILRQPHLLLEGLAIAAYAVEAKDICIYIRGEFTSERRMIEKALEAASEKISDFTWTIYNGHGAYICGEETALIESMEGKRGMPRLKPPYPTEYGFRGKPTLMHNVETAACVPAIVERGGEWFKDLGKTEPGTKLYCVSGHVNKPGVFELPLGVTLDELVEVAGGYDGEPVAFSPGGPSSGFLPISRRDVPLDFGHLSKEGSMLGSAGLVVLNDSVDMAKATGWQLDFFERESCGQCAPCRIGTRYLRRQVDSFIGEGDPDALEFAEDVGWEMEEGSICGLGMVAAKPLESAMKYFPEAFGSRSKQ
ncbi:MAG: NADH-quinone oxidoreductase subunit F [Acidobacteria bacterium]|nr:MAG: NADH-quinone oxidoreductase subunit F [Acidobacteriota bacterium]REJ98032.1 MAG: NADH-quinone oxidoreductase subunit F [Acidobacteriota bacterium]REK16775.1 MAG: NADH-quinone oxidoreductase subunit F [Acidobacteriota bacterium]REK42686.1 MAG: NADH-quinone oxidoreductase subunit F [Acidobacteriota bacterium]